MFSLMRLLFLLQIRFFLLQNRQGKTRLSKWYVVMMVEEVSVVPFQWAREK